MTIAGNLKDIFTNVAAAGEDIDTRGNIHTGSVLISSMMVAGSLGNNRLDSRQTQHNLQMISRQHHRRQNYLTLQPPNKLKEDIGNPQQVAQNDSQTGQSLIANTA